MKSIRSAYSSYLKRFTTQLGIHRLLSKFYWRFELARSPIVEQDIDDTVIKFKASNQAELRRYRDLGGEEDIIRNLLSEVKPDDVVYDIGANTGLYTCFLAKKLQANQVIAFEPHPANVEALRENLQLNNTDATIVRYALSDTTGSSELEVVSPRAGEGKHSLNKGSEAQTIDIRTITGDQFTAERNKANPNIVKIDVEGAEYQVLQGLEQALSRPNCRLCYIEIHPDKLEKYGNTEKEISSLIESHGFNSTVLTDRGSEHFLKCTKE